MKKLVGALSLTFALTVVSPDYSKAQTEVKQKTRTGMSHKKKGALIGAGAGAATGAVISKDKSKGAIIGGAIGAGAGYLHGRHKDKQDPTPKKVYKTKTVVQ
jgi:hypothetical protein